MFMVIVVMMKLKGNHYVSAAKVLLEMESSAKLPQSVQRTLIAVCIRFVIRGFASAKMAMKGIFLICK